MKILITGDFSPVNNIENLCRQGKYSPILGDFAEGLGEIDYFISNLECPLTFQAKTIEKSGPSLKAHPECVELLKELGVNVVTLANNHIMDYGEAGLSETIKLCNDANIKTVGAGGNLIDARKPIIIKSGNLKVGILNIAENEFSIAGDNRAGANGLNLINNYYDIVRIRPEVDFLMVIFHGGNEGYPLPRPGLKETFHFFADIGADAVIGHHPHCPGGLEYDGKKLLVYSLGNFLFHWPGETDENWYLGYAVKLIMNSKKDFKFELIPYTQTHETPGLNLMKGEEKITFLKKVDSLSKTIGDDRLLNKEWQRFAESKKKNYVPALLNYRTLKKKLYRKNIIKPDLNEAKIRTLLNYIRCESHREILIKILKRF